MTANDNPKSKVLQERLDWLYRRRHALWCVKYPSASTTKNMEKIETSISAVKTRLLELGIKM